MRQLTRTVTVLALAVAVMGSLQAAEKQKKAKKKDPAAQILKRLEAAELTEDQITKIKELATEYAPKLAAAEEAVGLTKEQKQARKDAAAKNKADGLKGKKAQKAIQAAMNLTEEQKTALAESQKLQTEFNEAAFALLSDEQREKAGLNKKRKGKKKAEAE
jgi:hypothetical protein